MSVEGLCSAWGLTDISPQEKLVLMHLGDCAGFDSRSHLPSIQQMARRASVSEEEVQHILRALAARGYIQLEPSRREFGAMEYRITIAQAAPQEVYA